MASVVRTSDRSQASRDTMPGRATSTVSFIHSWLSKLPSSPSGFSATGATYLHGTDETNEQTLGPGPHTTQHHPTQLLRPAQSAHGAQPVEHGEAYGAPPLATALQHMPQNNIGPTRGPQVQSAAWGYHQTPPHLSHAVTRQSSGRQPSPAMTHGPSISSQPGNQPRYMFAGHQPVTNNFHHDYSPVDSRQIVNAYNQKHHVPSGLHTPEMPTQTHAYYNQCDDVDGSGRDTITPSMGASPSGYAPAPATSNRDADTFGRAPSETIPLRRTRIKCTRGLFISKTISTHQHVVDDRPC